MERVLLVDIGSTNIKWAISQNGSIYERNYVPFPPKLPLPTPYFEVDIEEISKVFLEIVQKNSNVDGIFISTQMHGYVLMDRDYHPITNYISWQDKRAKGLKMPFRIDTAYGVSMKDNLPRASVYTLGIEQPSLLEKAHHFFTLGSYLGYLLTGKNITHISDAAPTGFYNLVKNTSAETVLNLPKASRDVRIIGEYQNIKVFTPIGDQQASILGAQATEDMYILNLGTAAQLCCIADGFVSGNFESRPYFHEKTLCTVTGLFGGDKIRNYTKDDIEEQLLNNYLEAIKRLPKSSNLLVIGGVLKYHKNMIESAMKKINIPFIFDINGDALDGLNTLVKEVNVMNKREVGIMISEVAFPNLPIILKKAGLDYFILDYEHGGFDYKDIAQYIMIARLSGIKVIIRLADFSRKDITKIMDMGADALLLPMTNTSSDIETVVNYAKYAPIGKRGISTLRAHSLYNPGELSEYLDKSNKRTEIYAQVETVSGIENIESILDVEGVDGFFIGPNDLSNDLGCLGDANSSKIIEAIKYLGKVSLQKKKYVGIITKNEHFIAAAKSSGITSYCIGSEISLLLKGSKDVVTGMKNG